MSFKSQHICVGIKSAPKCSWDILTQIGPTKSALREKTVVSIQSHIANRVAFARPQIRPNGYQLLVTWQYASPVLLILTLKKNVASTARLDTTWKSKQSLATHSARLALRIRVCTKMSWDKLLASSVEQGSCRATYICKQNLPLTEHANDARTDDISTCSKMLLLLPIRFVFILFIFTLERDPDFFFPAPPIFPFFLFSFFFFLFFFLDT